MFEKRCISCREIKPDAMFYKNATFKDGYEKKCKRCRRLERKQRYEEAQKNG